MSLEELSGRSGRSPHHVVVQLAWALCGVGRGDVNPMVPRFREPWSDTEHRALVDLHHRGVALAAIAAGLHRDLTDVAWRLVVERECLVGFTRAGSQS